MKFIILSLLLFISILDACPKKRILRMLSSKVYNIAYRIEHNTMHNRDYVSASELINSFNVLNEDLCDDCKEFARQYTIPHIDKITTYLALSSPELTHKAS